MADWMLNWNEIFLEEEEEGEEGEEEAHVTFERKNGAEMNLATFLFIIWFQRDGLQR